MIMYVSHLQQYKLGPNDDLKAKKVTLLASSYLVMGGGGGGASISLEARKESDSEN